MAAVVPQAQVKKGAETKKETKKDAETKKEAKKKEPIVPILGTIPASQGLPGLPSGVPTRCVTVTHGV